MQQQRRNLTALSAWVLGALAVIAQPCLGVDVVRKGKPVAAIVLPAQPLAVETYAAEELQYHVKEATAAQLPILSEDSATGSSPRIYLGHCRAAAQAGADPSGLPGNGYVLRTVGRDLYITGHDGPGEATDPNTLAGTLFAVYDILEEHLGVRWLWPGKLGEVIPSRKLVALPALNKSVAPLLWFKDLRGGYGRGDANEILQQQAKWLRRQRVGRYVQGPRAHSFGKYWERFGKTHPEYFAMMPDGSRGPEPLRLAQGPLNPNYIHMCVSEPGLWKQVIEDWKEAGMPEFLNICENDGYATCSCPRCLSWDVVDTELTRMDYGTFLLDLVPVPADKRFEAAKRRMEAKVWYWSLQLGSLSDRYAKFTKIIADMASTLRPDVKVVNYAYDNYRKPPFKPIPLGKNVMIGLVPWEPFPYNQEFSATFQKEWAGWEATGATMFLRPNYMLPGHNLPLFYARQLGQDLKFAMAHGMKGAVFGPTGQYSTQGPTLYMLVKILNHPDANVQGVIDEYCAAFGPARASVRKYFEHWEAVTQGLSFDKVLVLRQTKKSYGETMFPGLLEANEMYPPETMRKGAAILEEARKQAASDALASARVEWLAKGLKHVDLVMAAQRAFERAFVTGDRSDLDQARKELTAFREQNAAAGIGSFRSLSGQENQIWRQVQ